MNVLPDLPLNRAGGEKPEAVLLTGTSHVGALPPMLPPGTVLTRHSGTSLVRFPVATTQSRVGELAAVTSTPVTRKDSLTATVNEPCEFAPLGFEPRLIESESIVLPLHYRAMWSICWSRTIKALERREYSCTIPVSQEFRQSSTANSLRFLENSG